jgi:hypothetical protein
VRVSVYAVVVVCAGALAGCGKKGPPLAPYIRIPAAVQQIAARRSGNDVYISVTVPSRNIDASVPVAIARIEVYGYTGRTAPSRAKWPTLGTLIARVPIETPPEAGDTSHTPTRGDSVPAANAPEAGSIVSVMDTLTGDQLVPGPTAPSPETSRTPAASEAQAPRGPLRRFYTAFAFSPRGRAGPPGATVDLVLSPLPDAPTELHAAYSATELRLQWEPFGGALGYLLDHTQVGPEPPPFDELEERPAANVEAVNGPSGPVSYNVYRVIEPDPLAPLPATEQSTWNAAPPAPINATPIAGLTTTDSVQFDRRVCYTVRAVRGAGPKAVESPHSPPYCLTPVDVFPPAPPRSLAVVPAGQAINLIWEANDEPDVAGYVVLRGEAGDATLQPLTPVPIHETVYHDTAVKAGVRYTYAVVAIDSRLPIPNVSSESDRVEELAR